MLASDAANPEFVGAHNPDSRLAVQFYVKPIQNNFRTLEAGRPIFEDVVYVKIFTPGDQLNIIDTPARDDHKARFPMHWAHYQNTHGGDSREVGTPLKQWPLLTASQAEELKAIKFFTVEQIANASDAQIQKIGMAGGMDVHALRARAQAFLQVAQDTAVPQKQAEEIERLKQEAEEREAKHEREMAELREMVQNLAQNQKGKPGRKPKSPEAAA
jgi:hypothetical protein